MDILKLIIRNLKYYRQKHLLLALGISISAAVITGALIVGDSVQYSLNRIVSDRLGEIRYTIKSGDRYFTASLGEKLSKKLQMNVSPVLLANGMAIAEGGQIRINPIRILGIDARFDKMAGIDSFYSQLSDDEVIISENLASRLGVTIDEEVLFRITRASLIPMNAPFVSDRDHTISIRLKIKNIAGRDQLGVFSLENSQTAPFNAFISLKKINELMNFNNRANILLIGGGHEFNTNELLNILSEQWTLKDASLNIEVIDTEDEIQVNSERVFIDESTAQALLAIESLKFPVLTYFVNSFSVKDRKTPYSFISALPDSLVKNNEIIINDWLADDLGAGPGDTLHIKYYVMGPLRELIEKEEVFIIRSTVKMEGKFMDPALMPYLPGLSDAGNCRDWETGVPIDLNSIRDKDEEYWDKYKGTPKAFISLEKAIDLWKNRFGSYTSFRYSSRATDSEKLSKQILTDLTPSDLGFEAESTREKANFAARNGVNFSQLFAGLSFFLLAAGILLSLLLFLLNLEFRKDQLHTLTALGIPEKLILRIMFSEGILVTLPGAMAGLLLAILYNQGVFAALNSIWKDIVRTEMMSVDIQFITLLKGFIISILVSAVSIYFPLKRFLRKNIRTHRSLIKPEVTRKERNTCKTIYTLTGLIALVLITLQVINKEQENATVFFIAGGLLLISGIMITRSLLFHLSGKSFQYFNGMFLSLKNALRNPSRSMAIVILFALATFLVISTGSNRKDLFVNAGDPHSGTGGFLFYAESSVPVLHNLNDPGRRFEYGLGEGYSFVQFRKHEGDDASCLNLNKIMNPQIISTDPEHLAGRFSFVTHTDYLDKDGSWSALNNELPGKLIPAVADQTVIKWGLGMKTGDTLEYMNSMGEPIKLLLIGGLAPSIFQGKVIISNKNFLENFPQSSGTSVFLVEGNAEDSTSILNEINRGLRDYGMEISLTAKRLAEFKSVTNTYLSVFLVMGALGLLLGTIGLGIVLFKSTMERKNEIALMRAVGYGKKYIRRIIEREYFFLLTAGIGIGFLTAIIATLPSILSPNTEISLSTLIILVIILIGNGWLWTTLMTGKALKNKNIYEALRNE